MWVDQPKKVVTSSIMAANIQTIVAQVGIHENINHVMIETIQTAGKGIQYTKNSKLLRNHTNFST